MDQKIIMLTSTSNKISLKIVLIIPFIILTVAAVGLVGYFSFRNGKEAVNEVAFQLRSEITKRIESHVSSFLNTPQQINLLNAVAMQQGELDANNPQDLERHFWQQIKIFKSVTSIYFGNIHGGLVNSGREGAKGLQYVIATDEFKKGSFNKFLTDKKGNRTDLLVTVQNFDARTRHWYRAAVKKGTGVWSPVYILFTGQDMAVAASRPAYDAQNKLLGVVSVDLFLSHISNFLKSLTIGKKGRAFIVERSGLLIASSSNEKLFFEKKDKNGQRRLKATDSITPVIMYAAKSMIQRFGKFQTITGEQNIEFKINGQRYFLQVSPMRNAYGLDWLIAVVVAEADFMAQIKTNNRLTAFLIAITLSIVLFIGIFMAQRIIKPIITLRTAAVSLAKGEWKKEIKDNSQIVEISSLTQSFNQMAGRLHDMLNNLNYEIAERKQAEKALRTSHERFLTVLNSIDATIYVADMETHEILFVNKYMIEIFDREVTGEICWDVFRSESGPCAHCTNDQLVDKDGNPTGVCVWAGKNPITQKWYINYDRAIEWTDGHLVKIQISTDITDLKMMEEELRQAHKMESIGMLAGGIAHDFNNILSIIIGNSELALDDIPDWNRAHNNIKEIKTASLRAKDVVSQLLSFSRKTEQDQKPLDITKVIKESLKLIRSSVPSNIEIRDNIPETCEPILADVTQIHQVLINLCTNAAHAMTEAGGILEVTLCKLVLDERSSESFKDLAYGDYLELTVKDTGSGIDSKICGKIFDPYFTTKEVGKGTGMGLAVVHGIVKNHHGEIYLNSESGKGTSFTIVFPIVTEKPRHETEEILIEMALPRKGTILFVDDEATLVDLAKQILEKFGYKVKAMTDPVEALRKFKTNPDYFDLVISDMTMPQMSGVMLSEKLRKIRSDIPIIICTGHSALIDEEKAKEIGISAYAMKPITMVELVKLIQNVLKK
ncbi:MAG: response regulator [Desulfobacula sp.]|nr:response regulator [Desulfobacula sp.]